MRVYELRKDRRVCMVRPGQVIYMLSSTNNPVPVGNPCLVVVVPPRMPQMVKNLKALATNGLYSSADLYGLVDLVTGDLLPMPSLANRMVEIKDVCLVVGPPDEEQITLLCVPEKAKATP